MSKQDIKLTLEQVDKIIDNIVLKNDSTGNAFTEHYHIDRALTKHEMNKNGLIKTENAKSGDIMWAFEQMKAGKKVYRSDRPFNVILKCEMDYFRSSDDEKYTFNADDFESTWELKEPSNLDKARDLQKEVNKMLEKLIIKNPNPDEEILSGAVRRLMESITLYEKIIKEN